MDHLVQALDDTAMLVNGIRAEQWTAPTPCIGWTVRDVVRHMITGNDMFAAVLRGDQPSLRDSTATHDGADSSADFRRSADGLLAAFGSPGVMERVVSVPFGSVPGVVALHLRLVEALVHGWDIAHATGQPAWFDDEVADQELEFTKATLDGVPPGRTPFGPPQPVADTAPAIDRLAGLLGRTVPPNLTP
ncbi:MAG: TIGR03086 family metal-binding protein [Nocardioidaceae bacterium]